jgi:hypothetical protein
VRRCGRCTKATAALRSVTRIDLRFIQCQASGSPHSKRGVYLCVRGVCVRVCGQCKLSKMHDHLVDGQT